MKILTNAPVEVVEKSELGEDEENKEDNKEEQFVP